MTDHRPETQLELTQAKMKKVKSNIAAVNAEIKDLKEKLAANEKKLKVQQAALKSVQNKYKQIKREGDRKLKKDTGEAMGMSLLMGFGSKEDAGTALNLQKKPKKRFGLF